MGIFNLDSPLMNFLGRLADLVWLNILAIIGCIPIFTVGASMTALHYVSLKMVRNEEGYITKVFFREFKNNFKKATILWLIILLVVGFLYGDLWVIHRSGVSFPFFIEPLIYMIFFFFFCGGIYIFPIQAHFENEIFATIKNAYLMSVIALPRTFLMILIAALPIGIALLSLRALPLIILFGFSFPAYLQAALYSGIFKRFE